MYEIILSLHTPVRFWAVAYRGVIISLTALPKTMKTTNVLLSGELTKLPVLFRPKKMAGWICAFTGAVMLEMGYILSRHGSIAPFVNGATTVYDNIIVGCLGLAATCCMLGLLLETSRLWLDAEIYPQRPLRWVIAGLVAGIITGMIIILNLSIGTFEHLGGVGF